MEDNYYDFDDVRNSKKKIFMIIFFILIIIGALVFVYYNYNYTLHIKRNLKFELGSDVSYEISKYVSNTIVDEDDYSINFNAVPIEDNKFSEVGTFTLKIKYKNVTKEGKIKVVDTISPVVTVNDLIVGLNEEIELDDFIKTCDELSKPCAVTFQNKEDEDLIKVEGEHIVRLLIKDTYKNETSVSANLIVKKGYDSKLAKRQELEIAYTEPIYDDFDNRLFLKLDKGYLEEELDENEEYVNFIETTGGDLHKYIGEEYANNRIDDVQIITVYNKFDYIIGYSVKIKLDNGKEFYLKR